jgi:O-methyltransferase
MFNSLRVVTKVILGKGTLLERFSLITQISKWILPEYKFKWPQMDWWNDIEFSNFVEEFDGKNSNNQDRRWMSFQLMRIVEDIEGDTVECGVWKGATSKMMLNMNSKSKFTKQHHIFDSFEGLSEPTNVDGSHWAKNNLSIGESIVIKNLSPYENFKLYKGWIPHKFKDINENKFSFIHVDVDLYEPTRDSIEFFYNKMSDGAIFLCDDYGFTSCPGATKAIDDFLKDKNEKIISLSGGAGFFIKGTKVSENKNYKVTS